GRNVPFRLAFLAGSHTPDELKSDLTDAVQSLRIFEDNLPQVVAHSRRISTHMADDAVAPYYFGPNIPFATPTLNIVEDEINKISKTPFRGLDTDRWILKNTLLSQINEDGLFVAPDESFYTDAKAWANAFGGIALLPLIEGATD